MLLKAISLAIAGLTLIAGCASTPAAAHHSSSPGADVATLPGPPFTPLALPSATAEGPEREVQVLVDAPHLKSLAIVLRKGTLLPTHNAAVPVIIQATSGAGYVFIGNDRVRIDAEHFVTLAPKVSHSVEPDAGTNLVLLVHHLRGAAHHPESQSENVHDHHGAH